MNKTYLPLPPEEARGRRLATDPKRSAWVAANAGSGKTTILRNRVIRLLLAGVPPDRILCLTFTKAAAAEMAARIFAELARWVGLEDAALASAIADLTGEPAASLNSARLARARRLFAEAVETPGGLKLQTIHAFAERILQLFPIEAEIPVNFAVLDEAEARSLREEARRFVLMTASEAPASALGIAFETILDAVGLAGFGKAVGEALDVLTRLRSRAPGAFSLEFMPDGAYEAVFGCPIDAEESALEARFAREAGGIRDPAALAEALGAMKLGKFSKPSHAFLMRLARSQDVAERLEAFSQWGLTQKNEARKDLLEKPLTQARPDIAAALSAAQAAYLDFRVQRRAIRALQRSRALRLFADAVLTRFNAAKAARNALDFDDLIARLRRMLLSGQAAWVMLKLDAAIEHILVDEAQDTTPDMWDIIKALADDFFAGVGQSKKNRTIFVVGDEKQSIFSFQGAEPDVFDAVRGHFAGELANLFSEADNLIARPVRLNYSFRSSADILAAIDAVFAHPGQAIGLSASGEAPAHSAAIAALPGLVEIWPVEEPEPKPEKSKTRIEPDEAAPALEAETVDSPPTPHPSLRAARKIASEIARWLDEGAQEAGDARPIRPEDILILVRTRNRFFHAMLRELKLRNIPVAGADRLKLAEEIAIHDLIALARIALLPADDLTLAAALKSPLIGLDDPALETLCRDREGALREAIAASEAPAIRAIDAWLEALEAAARVLPPYEFFNALLIEPCPGRPGGSGRAALLSRLGPDIAEPIDALLNDALAFQMKHPASLRHFIEEMAGRQSEIKRDLDQGEGQVRVMTIHAAKGLEARIVIIGDAMGGPPRNREPAVFLSEGAPPLLFWAGSSEDEADPIKAERVRQREKNWREYRRLLYVALTRAEERLYVTAYRHGKTPKPKVEKAKAETGNEAGNETGKKKAEASEAEKPALQTPWYILISDALSGRAEMRPLAPREGEPVPRLRWVSAANPPRPSADAAPPAPRIAARPAPSWLFEPVLPEQPALAAIAPARALAAAIQSFETQESDEKRAEGILIHALFEALARLPVASRPEAARRRLRLAAPEMDEIAGQRLTQNILAALESPEGQRLFGEFSRGEVAICGEITLENGGLYPVSGRIDRLLVTPEGIELLDIKTGHPRRAVSDRRMLTQMALYAALLRQLYPEKPIRAQILWSQNGAFELLPEAALKDALSALIRPDGAPAP